MRTVFLSCVIGLLLGIILGYVYPVLASMWSILVLCGVFLVAELIGRVGFGGEHWDCFRFSVFIIYVVPLICLWVGIQFGSGHVGAFLVFVGRLIS